MRLRRNDAGFSLVEVLVTVVIIGITFAVFVGGMGTSFVASDRHRKQAVTQAGIRNFAEAVKAVPFSSDCANLAATYAAAYSPPPPIRRSTVGTAPNATSHVAPSVITPSTNSALLAFYAVAVGTSFTPNTPAGMTAGWTRNSNSTSTSSRVSVLFADQAISPAGATGARTASSGNPGDSVAQLVSLPRAVSLAVAPTRRGALAAATPVGGAASLTLTSPAATTAGDAMVAQIAVRGATTSVSPPPGWTLVNAKTFNTITSLLYERTATRSGSNTFGWSFSAVTEAAGGIVSYGGASTSGYQATVTSVKFWDETVSPPAFVTTCPAPESNSAQLVSLRLVGPGGTSDESIDIVKRCNVRPTPISVCEDSS